MKCSHLNLIRKLLVILIVACGVELFAIRALAAEGYYWPTPNAINTSQGYSNDHKGIDISAPVGTEIYSTKSGTIVKIFNGCNHVQNYGNYCTHDGYGGVTGIGNGLHIKHDDGTWAEYAHMLKDSFPDNIYAGARVEQGQFIGLSGNSGNSSGPHLHFGIRVNGQYVNPLNYYN